MNNINPNPLDFDFLNYLPNKKDLSQSPVFSDPGMFKVLEDIVKSIKNITTSFRIGAYKIGIVTNKDREEEIIDIRHKLKEVKKDIKTKNIDETVYRKLSIVIIISEARINNVSENTLIALQRANNKFLSELDNSWTLLDEIGEYSMSDSTQHSCQVIDIWVPDIKYSFCEVKGSLYYLTFNKYSKINLIENGTKVHIKRFSIDVETSSNLKILIFYYISLSEDGIITVEFNGKKGIGYNLFHIMEHYNIKNSLLKDYPDDICLQETYKAYMLEKEKGLSTHITQVECDTSLLVEGVKVLLGHEKPTPFKYYRYGSIVDAISYEIISIIAKELPTATGTKTNRYYDTKDEDLVRCLENIKKKFKHNMFMSVLAKTGQDGIKSTYNENMAFYPLKVGKTDEIETIFFEDSIGLQDPYGTSQTSNVLKILSIPVYIDPKYLG